MGADALPLRPAPTPPPCLAPAQAVGHESFEDTLTGAIVRGQLVRDLFESDAEESATPTPPTASRGEEEEHEHQIRRFNAVERELVERQDEAWALEKTLAERDQTHRIPTAQLLQNLQTDEDKGLSDAEAAARLAPQGANELERERTMTLGHLFVSQFASVLVFLLMVASAASLALGEWAEGIAVLAIVFLNAVVATSFEHTASSALRALSRMTASTAACVREGRVVRVPARDLVTGDVVLLAPGDVVPADVRLVQAASLRVNEALLTGEPDDTPKSPRDGAFSEAESHRLTAPNMAFAASAVASGEARGVVVATGMNTRVGCVANLLCGTGGGGGGGEREHSLLPRPGIHRRTPLQHRLHRLGLVISVSALVGCVAVFAIAALRGHRDPSYPNSPTWLHSFMVAASLAVSSIPEGLPLCVTICLALVRMPHQGCPGYVY